MTQTPRLLGLAFLALAPVAVSTEASANQVASDGYSTGTIARDERPAEKRVEGRLGMLLGGSDVGDADGFSIGVSAGLGYRIGDVTLRTQFDHFRVGDSVNETLDRRGRATRIGGLVRYSFANNFDQEKTRKGLAVDFWGEAGVGLEHVSWRQGGVLDRPSGEVAVGFELDGFGRRDDKHRRRHVGYFMAFRTLMAEGPQMDGVQPTCGGPCDKATRPSRLDVSMFFELGLHWGR